MKPKKEQTAKVYVVNVDGVDILVKAFTGAVAKRAVVKKPPKPVVAIRKATALEVLEATENSVEIVNALPE